jgi:MtfA peptidase
MFHWLRNYKRKRLRATHLNQDSQNRMFRGAWQWSYLPESLKTDAINWAKIFVAEKNWEGCGGFAMSDLAKWTVAGQAALMTLAYPDWYFDHTMSILIYPEAYVAPGPVGDMGNGIAIIGESSREGETSYRGPIILNWREVKSAARGLNHGNHLVVHEFSHQFDMINGRSVDGIPPLPHNVDAARWQRQWIDELETLRDQVHQGVDVLINDYGLSSQAEFFAVCSELFFQVPHELHELHPTIFEMLLSFYQKDFREWLPRNS